MLVFRKKRSPSHQKEHVASASTAISAIQNETDWVSNAFRVAELASAAGGLLPFPYLKGAAELVKTLLKPIQQMQQNQDGYKTLTINVTTILQILYEEIKKDPEIAASSLNYFEKDCEVFYRYLQHISNDLKSFNDKPGKSRFIRRYFAADRERDCLARFKNQIEEFRNNLVVCMEMFDANFGLITMSSSGASYVYKRAAIQTRRPLILGDLNVLRNNSNGSVEHWEVRWRHETQTRMVRVYKGQNATSRFKAEKEWYSRIRHPNVMQLFGLITCKDRPGLVFHNPWCIPADEYDQRFCNALDLCVDFYRKEASYAEGLDYVEASACHHAFLSWRIRSSFHPFIGFKDRDDGYRCRDYVSLLDGCGVIALDWSPNILRDVPTHQWEYTSIDKKPQKELARIIETVNTLRLSKQSDVPLDPYFLWDFYGAIWIRVWRDVPAPAYSVCTGDILLANEKKNRLEASNAVVLGFIPYEEPSLSDWIIRDGELQKHFKTPNRLSVEDCGGHFRIRVSVDIASISPAEDLETVVIDYDVWYSDWATLGLLARAYVSQVAYLHTRLDRKIFSEHMDYIVTGFSWHLQIPTRLGCSIGTSEYKDLYFFIPKPAEHDETLDTYWSLDPSGSKRLNCSNIDTLGFNLNSFSIQKFRTLRAFNIHIDDFGLIWDVHVLSNIDPESNEGARILGLPLMWIQHAGLDDVSDDIASSYHTAEDESVDIDEDGSVDIDDDESVDIDGDESVDIDEAEYSFKLPPVL